MGEYRVTFDQLAQGGSDGIYRTYRRGELIPLADADAEQKIADGEIERVEPKAKPAPAKGKD